MEKQITEKISIKNPIGNLYRKNHVLVLVTNNEGNFILGKKQGFYPDHIARMIGGGIKEDEQPIDAAQREVEEEFLIKIPRDSFTPLCLIKTSAETNEGDMEMNTHIFTVKIVDSTNIKPSDDITGIKVYSEDEYTNLLLLMSELTGEFVTEKFSFDWSDWGKIYEPIHRHAIEIYKNIL